MLDPNISKGIVAGLVTWLIVFVLFQPLMSSVAPLIGTGASRVLSGVANTIYADAARGPSSESADFLLYVLTVTAWTFGIGAIAWIFKTRVARLAESREQRRSGRWLAFAFPALLFMFNLTLSYVTATNIAATRLNRTFDQRVNVVAPYLSDLEEEKLRAQWASMSTRQDFAAIRDSMNKLAKKHFVKLPPSAWW